VGVHRVGYGIVGAAAAGPNVALLTEEGLVIADPWDPGRLEVVGTLPLEARDLYGYAHHLAFQGNAEDTLLSVVSGPRLTVVDLSDPSRPTTIGRYSQPSGVAYAGHPRDWRLLSSAIDGYHVHLTAEGGGYMVMEIDALRPTWTSTIALPFAVAPR